MTRPQTASVCITDFGKTSGFNPRPIKFDDDEVEYLEEFLSPRKLKAITGVDNLEEVDYLEMQVDADGASLGNFGIYLPNLRELKLSNSIIPSMRDLGTSLNSLEILWMPRCCLECLDGVVTMCNMRELYLAYNELKDISPCGMLENIEILDLEGNLIEDYNNLSYLTMCHSLSKITLEGNPFCLTNCEDYPDKNYRSIVASILPQLKYLDDIPLDDNDGLNKKSDSSTLEFDSHWEYINSVLKDTGLIAESEVQAPPPTILPGNSGDEPDEFLPQASSRSGTPLLTASSGISMPSPVGRPCSSLRPNSAQRRLQSSRSGRLGTASSGTSSMIRPPSSTSAASLEEEPNDESALTSGNVVCGNISKALRRRKPDLETRSGQSSPMGTAVRPTSALVNRSYSAQSATNRNLPLFSAAKSPQEFSSTRQEPSTNTDPAHYNQILDELKEWRKGYEISRQEVEKDRAPQVLKITHDESINLEESSGESDSDIDTPGSSDRAINSASHPAHTENNQVADFTFDSVKPGVSGLRQQRPACTSNNTEPNVTSVSTPCLNKNKPIPQITPTSKSPNSPVERSQPTLIAPNLTAKIKKPLPVLPSKPSIPKP